MDDKGEGHDDPGPANWPFQECAKIKTYQTHTTCRMVQGTDLQQGAYTVMKDVVETQCRKVPYTKCTMVKETMSKQVPQTSAKCRSTSRTKQICKTICEKQCYTVEVCVPKRCRKRCLHRDQVGEGVRAANRLRQAVQDRAVYGDLPHDPLPNHLLPSSGRLPDHLLPGSGVQHRLL